MNLYYEIHGEGFPLVMIAGLSVDCYWWDKPIIEELSNVFKVIVFDNIGIGRSNGVAPTQIKTMADDTVGLMNALNIEKAHIFGISLGGMIAQELVLNYPEKVEKLVLCSTNCGGSITVPASNEVNQLMFSFTKADHDITIAKKVLPLIFTEEFMKDNPKYVEEKLKDMTKAVTTAGNYTNQLQAGMKFDTRKRLSQINTPTLILHGKQDILIPPKNGEILKSLIPGAELIYFDKPAHWLFVPEPDIISKTIIEFLK